MKNIIKFIAVFMLPLLVVTSCVDEDKLFEISDFKNGAIANLTPTSNDDGFLNLLDINASTIEFTVDFQVNSPQNDDGTGGDGREGTNLEWAKASSVDLEITYANALTGVIEHTVIDNFTTWPVTQTFKANDLVNLFPSLSDVSDLNLGDQFVFVTGVNLADGTALPAFVKDPAGKLVPGYSVNYTGDTKNSGVNFSLTYNVSCPSEIPTDGTWAGATQDGAFGIFSTNTGITITALGGGKYSISDVTAGFYAAFGFNVNQPVTFEDVCNNETIIGIGSDTQFTIITDAGSGFPNGTWDPVTETLTIPWYDSGNGFGDTTVFTRE